MNNSLGPVKKIGFVELPDEALEVLTHYTQDPRYRVSLVISLSPQSYAARMADVLRIPVLDTASRPALVTCDRLVVGNNPTDLATVIGEMLGSESDIEILTLDQVAAELKLALPEIPARAAAAPAAPAGAAGRPGRIFRPRETSGPTTPPGTPIAPESTFAERLQALPLDADGEDLLGELLVIALEAVGAEVGTLLVPEDNGRHLRVATTQNNPPHLTSGTRERIGVGPAGEAYASGTPRRVVERWPVNETAGSAILASWSTAYVPILSGSRSVGVVSASVRQDQGTLGDDVLESLCTFGQEAGGVLLKALDLHRLSGSLLREDLLREIDRIMGTREPLPARLQSITEFLERAFEADYAHLYLVDPLGRRLDLAGGRTGMTTSRSRSQPIDRGFLGWIVRRGRTQVLEASDDRTGERQSMIFLPVSTSDPHGVLVLENVSLSSRTTADLVRHLDPIVDRVAGKIEEEEDRGLRELESQIILRVEDDLSALDVLPPAEQADALLALAVRTLAAEAAMWIPRGADGTLVSHAEHDTGADLLVQAGDGLDEICGWILERGAVAGGAYAPGWDASAPRGPSPYVGVASENQEILLVFFPPEEELGAAAQIPPQVHFKTLLRIADLFAERARAA